MTGRRLRTRALRVAGLLLTACLVGGCGQPSPAPTSRPPGPTATPSPTGAAQDLKPVIKGLIDRDGPPPSSFGGTVTAFVANVNWSDLQPSPFGPLAANNAIDQAIARARQMGGGIGVKIRLYAGVDAPGWVKALDGGPVTVGSTTGQAGGTIGRFWTDDFGRAYDDVWNKLAAAYDSVPEVREITVSRCMTIFAETFIRDTADPTTVANLLNAGYTDAADRTCIEQEISDGTAWHHTRIGVAFNPYQEILAGGVTGVDESFTESMMQMCRSTLGAQCVLENNSIRWPPLPGAYQQMYAAMQQLGPPIAFQTAASARVGDLAQTLTWAVQAGADAVELPTGYQSEPVESLATVTSSLEQNPS